VNVPLPLAPAVPLQPATALASGSDCSPAGSGVTADLTLGYETYVTGGSGAAQGRAVALDADRDQFVAGLLTTPAGATLGFVAKYLPSGVLDARYGTGGVSAFALTDTFSGATDLTEFHGVAVLQGGSADVVGTMTDPTSGNHTAFFGQVDRGGAQIVYTALTVESPNPYPNSFDSVAVDGAGNGYATGVVSGVLQFPQTGGLGMAQFDPTGQLTSGVAYDFSGSGISVGGSGIAVDGAGSVALVAGTAIDNGTGTRFGFDASFTVSPITIDGAYLLSGSTPGDVVLSGVAMVPGTPTSGYFAGGTSGAGGTHGYVARINELSGAVTAEYTLASSASSLSGIAVAANGNVYVIGTDVNPATGRTNAVVQALDAALANVLASALVGGSDGSGNETGSAIALDASGNVYGVGTTTSDDVSTDGTTLNGPSDAWLFRLDNP
jgi:hypothetical protein